MGRAAGERLVKTLLLVSPKGGSGKSTAAVRLAESLTAKRIPAAILDLSPYPTASFTTGLTVAPGRGATSAIAARALLRPLAEKAKVCLIDTGELSDPALEPWFGVVDAMLVVSRLNKQAIGALPAAWTRFAEIRKANPSLRFLGILPTFASDAEKGLRDSLAQRLPQSIFPVSIPFDAIDHQRLQARCFEGAPALPARSAALDGWDAVATILAKEFELQAAAPAEEAKPTAMGVLGRLWKSARSVLGGPRVEAVGAPR